MPQAAEEARNPRAAFTPPGIRLRFFDIEELTEMEMILTADLKA
jgi:hypothetical protein